MKSCRICRTENEDTNKFCTECGALFEESPSAFEEEAGLSDMFRLPWKSIIP